jgi:hypothetical protein
MGVELFAYRIGDHESEARSIDYRSDGLVDLAVGFRQRDGSGYGLLNSRDCRESGGSSLELGDELSRQ